MEAIVPYLNFNGNASEALEFYAKAFGGQVTFRQNYSESPMESAPEWKDKVMHATFQAGALNFMVSDIMPGHTVIPGSNVSLSMNFKDVESIDRVFAALSEGANITMPLQDTFWGARFGMLIDKFSVNWMFNHDYEQKGHS